MPWPLSLAVSAIESTPILRRAVRRGLEYVRASDLLQRHVIPRLVPTKGLRSTVIDGSFEVGQTMAELARISRSGAPVVVGPWLSEVGFELLYWIPFLNWCTGRFGIARERIVVVSRGGTAPWYRALADRYVEMFDYYSPEEFRARNLERIKATGGQKHRAIGTFDRDIVGRVRAEAGLGDVLEWLHPSMMYNLFVYFWRRRQPLPFLVEHTEHRPFPPLREGERLPDLPERYVAAKFYFSPSFPDSPANREFIRDLVTRIAAGTPVVLLRTGLRVDDHRDWGDALPTGANVVSVEKRLTPAGNLAVQTAVVSGATAFIGTYGGFSYLAPYYGVPSIGVYADENGFLPIHLEVARQVLRPPRFGSFTALGVMDVERLRQLLA